MRLGVLQFTPEFGKKLTNLGMIDNLLKGVDADLVVLPELAITGYLFLSKDEVIELSEPVPDGPSVKRLQKIAERDNVYLVVGFLERDGERFYNSSLLIHPDGMINVYRKVHLFYEEKLFFEPGNLGFPVFDLKDVKVGMMVCFDWIYPEAARSLALKGAQIIAHPANLVLPYCQDAMITRSIENKVFTVTANRAGEDIRGEKVLSFTGMSQIVSPKGERLLTFTKYEETLKVIEVDPDMAKDKYITEHNHIFKDRRVDMYSL